MLSFHVVLLSAYLKALGVIIFFYTFLFPPDHFSLLRSSTDCRWEWQCHTISCLSHCFSPCTLSHKGNEAT